MIHDLGDLPIHLAKPILRRIDRPDQLHEIELNSLQYAEDTPELWQRLIARDFPQWEKKNYVPKNPLSWWRVYARYKRENDEELAAAQDKLKSAFSALKAHKDSRTTVSIATKDLPRLPKDGRPVGVGRGPGRGLPDHLTWGGGSRTKLTDGQSFLKKARREARELVMRRQLSTPTGKLRVPDGQIKKAPQAMVHQYKVQKQQELRIRAPRREKTEAQLAEEAERRNREARLLKIKNLAGARPAQIVSDSEDDDDDEHDTNYRGLGDILGLDEDDDDDDGDGHADLFGDDYDAGATSEPQRSSKTSPTKQPAHQANYHSDSSSAPAKRPALLSNARKAGSGLLSSRPAGTLQKRVVPSPSKSSAPPTQPLTKANNPPSRPPQPLQPQSSPPLRPQAATLAGSPPPAGLRKRKPQVDVFMRNTKKPKN
jgi:elongin-A